MKFDIKGAARHALHWPEVALHPNRRRHVVARLRRDGRPSHVLFVCHGNICRSPYAEARLHAVLSRSPAAEPTVASAGFLPPGRPAHRLAIEIGRARGLDLSPHRSRLVEPGPLPPRSLVLVMAAPQVRAVVDLGRFAPGQVVVLGDLDPLGIRTRDIPDPYGGPPALFTEVFDRIDRCISTLVGSWEGIR